MLSTDIHTWRCCTFVCRHSFSLCYVLVFLILFLLSQFHSTMRAWGLCSRSEVWHSRFDLLLMGFHCSVQGIILACRFKGRNVNFVWKMVTMWTFRDPDLSYIQQGDWVPWGLTTLHKWYSSTWKSWKNHFNVVAKELKCIRIYPTPYDWTAQNFVRMSVHLHCRGRTGHDLHRLFTTLPGVICCSWTSPVSC